MTGYINQKGFKELRDTVCNAIDQDTLDRYGIQWE
jgi:hypothetical protein